MNTQPTTDGVLSVVERHCQQAEQAIAQAHESLATLPVIFEASEGISNRDTAYWGVSEATVRRYRLVSAIIELEWEPGFDLLHVRKVIGDAFRTTGVKADDVRDAIEASDTALEAVVAVEALIAGVKADKAEAQADADESDEADETEAEQSEADKVLKWLTAVRGPLGKVREAVVGGHTLTAEQAEAFDEVLSLVTGIASARAFVPAEPVAV